MPDIGLLLPLASEKQKEEGGDEGRLGLPTGGGEGAQVTHSMQYSLALTLTRGTESQPTQN